MNKTKTFLWITEEHLKKPEDMAAYLEAVIEDGDPELITHAAKIIARSEGIISDL